MSETVLQQFVANPEGMRLFQQEQLAVEIADLICKTMRKQHVTQSELAQRLQKSKGRVSQILSGDSNLTLRTVADVFTALDKTLCVSAVKMSAESEPMQMVSMLVDQTYQTTSYSSWGFDETFLKNPVDGNSQLAG
jgi:transcriptional regulator with XRE-family HTH domain